MPSKAGFRMKTKHTHDRRRYAFLGFLLGLGAPAGWLAWRFAVMNDSFLLEWTKKEFEESGQVYAYMAIGTVIIFTLFGYFLGRRGDVFADEASSTKDSLEQVSALAITDALTGLHNARYLHHHLALKMESAQRYGTPVSCLMLDIDDFKAVNDKHGHPTGDIVLIQIAKIMRDCIRRIDIVGRLGGEEFLVVMPHTTAQTALPVAERIRQAVQNCRFPIDHTQLAITVSVGVAHYPTKNVTDKNSLLKATDDALYQAKKAGKNRTVVLTE